MKSASKKSHSRVRSLGGLVLALALLARPGLLPAQDKEAEAAYEAAAGLFNLGLWAEAAAGYREYFKKHPKHPLAGHAHYGLGLCHFNLKDYASAARELKSAAGKKGPNPVEVNLYWGQALMMKTPSQPKDAEEAFETSLKALGFSKTGILRRTWDGRNVKKWLDNAKNAKKKEVAADVFIGLLEATYLQGDWKSVVAKVEAFEAMIKKSRVEQRARVLTGEAFSKSRNYKAAAVAYEVAAKLKGKDASEALFRLGLVRLNHLRDFTGAARDFNTFTQKYKKDAKQPDAAFNEALCYFHSYYGGKKDHLNEAVDRFAAFAKANPKHKLDDTAQFNVGKLEHTREGWKAAVNALEPLLGSKDPTLGQLVFLVADSYHHLENWEMAAKFYLQFAQGNEQALNADVALHNAGVAFSNLKKPDLKNAIAAYELLERKCPQSPHLPSARLKLGIIHYQAGRFPEAQRPLQKIPARHPLRADADYFLAWTELDNKNPKDAAKQFAELGKRLKKAAPKHRLIPLANLYQGIAEFERRRFGESVKILSKFVGEFSRHEKLDEAAFNLGLAQMELRRWGDAIKSFETVPDSSDIHDRALYQAAWSKRSAGKPTEALPYYEALLKQHADSPLANNVTLELAEVEFETGGKDGGADAVKRLTALLKKKPAPNAKLRQLALYRLGIVQFKQKKMEASAKAFEELLQDAPANLVISAAWQAGEARRQVALAAKGAAKAGEYRSALKNYEIAAGAKAPAQADQARLQQQTLIRIGQTLASLEQWAASQKSFEKFIAANPEHELIRTASLGLGWAMQNQEKYPGAIKSLEKAVTAGIRDDTGARAQFLLGECYLEQKNYDKAIIEFAKVESLYAFPQWQSKAAYEMAQALLRKENRAGARRQFERLVKRYPDTPAATAAKAELKRLN
jgi:TolA-binding protein